VIDRFLEHARIFHFRNGGQDEVFCSSADWMPRNFRRRVEVMYPVLDESLRSRMIHEVLGTMRADQVKSWSLSPNGSYVRKSEPGGVRSQQRFVELARERGRESEALLGLTTKATLATPATRALDKLRRRDTKKRKRKRREE
jgi:polyphosphate kinase